MSIAKVNNFMYEHDEVIGQLVKVLEEGRTFTNLDPMALRCYKLLVAIHQLRNIKKCTIRKTTKQDKVWRKGFEITIASLKKEAIRLEPSMKSLVFFEQARKIHDSFFFYNYVEDEMDKQDFGTIWCELCEELAVSRKSQRVS